MALVQFSSLEEAKSAFESSDAVCGNRFVKLFYYRINEGGRNKKPREEVLEVTVSHVMR